MTNSRQPEIEPLVTDEEETSFSSWMRDEMERQGLKIGDLAARTGLTYVGIWNIERGNTKTPRQETRQRIAEALKETVPDAIESDIRKESTELQGLKWADFTPFDELTIPEEGGVYVFYDVSDRPVYVGMSRKNARNRIKDHQTRFWFKPPVVTRGAFLAVPDEALCKQIESILIKFLGRHLLINDKQVGKWADA